MWSVTFEVSGRVVTEQDKVASNRHVKPGDLRQGHLGELGQGLVGGGLRSAVARVAVLHLVETVRGADLAQQVSAMRRISDVSFS